jgi:hypothetical protein
MGNREVSEIMESHAIAKVLGEVRGVKESFWRRVKNGGPVAVPEGIWEGDPSEAEAYALWALCERERVLCADPSDEAGDIEDITRLVKLNRAINSVPLGYEWIIDAWESEGDEETVRCIAENHSVYADIQTYVHITDARSGDISGWVLLNEALKDKWGLKTDEWLYRLLVYTRDGEHEALEGYRGRMKEAGQDFLPDTLYAFHSIVQGIDGTFAGKTLMTGRDGDGEPPIPPTF